MSPLTTKDNVITDDSSGILGAAGSGLNPAAGTSEVCDASQNGNQNRLFVRSCYMKKMFIFSLLPFVLPLFFPSGSADAQIAKEKPLMTKVLPDIAGEEGLIETVVLSPGEVVPAHRHNADVFAFVLEGSIVTQLKGYKSETVHAGEAFYESPRDVHIASRNASATQPARLLVFFVKKIGAPTTVAVSTANAAR